MNQLRELATESKLEILIIVIRNINLIKHKLESVARMEVDLSVIIFE